MLQRPVILAGGRMVQVFNDHSEDITFTGLTFDLKRPTVSEFGFWRRAGPRRSLPWPRDPITSSKTAGSNGPATGGRETPARKLCPTRAPAGGGHPRGWKPQGQVEAAATDLGGRKVRQEFPGGESGLTAGHQYHFRNTGRDRVGVHDARCARITFRDCTVHALVGMGFVSQFTDTITYQRVDVVPPPGTLRTCPAWADIFQFQTAGEPCSSIAAGCRECRTTPSIVTGPTCESLKARRRTRLRCASCMVRPTGSPPLPRGTRWRSSKRKPCASIPATPAADVTAVEQKNEKEWLLTFDGPVPKWEKEADLDNITWYPERRQSITTFQWIRYAVSSSPPGENRGGGQYLPALPDGFNPD